MGLARLTLFGITDAVIIPVEGAFPATVHWAWQNDVLAAELVGVLHYVVIAALNGGTLGIVKVGKAIPKEHNDVVILLNGLPPAFLGLVVLALEHNVVVSCLGQPPGQLNFSWLPLAGWRPGH